MRFPINYRKQRYKMNCGRGGFFSKTSVIKSKKISILKKKVAHWCLIPKYISFYLFQYLRKRCDVIRTLNIKKDVLGKWIRVVFLVIKNAREVPTYKQYQYSADRWRCRSPRVGPFPMLWPKIEENLINADKCVDC